MHTCMHTHVLAVDSAQEAVCQGPGGFCSKPLEGGQCQHPSGRLPCWGRGARSGVCRCRDLSGTHARVGISLCGHTPGLSAAFLQDSGWLVLVKCEPRPRITKGAANMSVTGPRCSPRVTVLMVPAEAEESLHAVCAQQTSYKGPVSEDSPSTADDLSSSL